MAIVYLPLSGFSKKIIQAEYGAEPVQPGRACWLSDMLRIDRSDTQFHQRTINILNSGLEIEVSPALADRVTKQAERIGVIIHRHHVEMLTRHMLSASNSGAAAKTAMQAFYEQYQIDDDDLDQQTLYREFGRFKKKFFNHLSAKSATKSTDRVRRESRIWQGLSAEKNRMTNMQLEALCKLLDDRLASCRFRRVKRLQLQAHQYIYTVVGGRTAVQVAKKFNRHKANVWKSLLSVRRRIRSDKRFAAAILPVLDGSAVLPTLQPQGDICINSPAVPEALAFGE